ncbi:Phage tail length tape-measure protein [Pseudomonas chlororaphis subsp. aurantiaca]|uniref:phage tail tape measure protein n=1 Tax=Pseudomonas chlororaphis TaxID=587753 RepID=UPI000F560B87|nr:phage tail tape measure protein [Pseudomonas chlororaphis]AZD34652.1 Phage tail length tape-measure protein [Pseudomonas chlororaphis subsp. aurantiaca]AZD40987.1 Phage tail length tape-measure protein [Pseudomonas chlororaphis subsp. aurantiaca]
MNDLKLQVLLNAIDRATGPLRSIDKSSIGAARALKEARDKLKALNAQQKDVSAWRTQRAAAEQTGQALNASRDKVKALSQQIAATGVPTKAMTRDFKAAVREAQRLKQQHQQQNEQLQGLRSRLQGTGISTRNLSSHERQLREQITATNGTISEQGRRLRLLNAQHERTAKSRAVIDRNYDRRKQFASSAAVGGAAGITTAYGIGRGVYAPLQEGKHFALEEQRVAALGLGKEDTSKAISFAKEMKTYGTSVTENLTLVRDAMTVFADEHEAEMVAPTLAKMKFANHAMYGEEQGADNERKFMDMLKVIELRGGLASKEAFVNQADIVQRVLTATGGRVGPNEWLNVIKTGGVAAKGIKDDAFYYQLEPLVQEMGGHRVGTAMMSAYSNIYQGRTTKRAANNLEALGLVDPKKVKHDKAGQIAFLDVGAIKGSDMFRENQFEWLEKVLLPQLKAKGITEKSQVLDTIGSIFSNRTASNLFAQMYLQREQIHKNAKLNAGADGIDQLYDKGLDSVQGKELELLAQRANTYREMSQAILPTYVAALKSVTEVIKGITAWMKENPVAAAIISKTLIAVGALAATFGALALTLASLLGPFAVISYGLSLFGLKGAGATKTFQKLAPTLTGLARNAFPMLAQGVRVLASTFSGALLGALRVVSIALWGLATNPVALVIGAVVATLLGGAYLIYKNWDAVKAYFSNAWTEIKAGFSGGIGSILTVLANFSPIGLVYQAFAGVLNYLGVDLPNRFTEFGNMIVNGLVSGLYAGLGQIKNAVTSIGDSTINWFKEKLDIHSPSRVFAELGGFTMQGLALGLEGGAKGPLTAMTNMGKQLTAAGSLALGSVVMPALAVDDRPPISSMTAPAYDSHDTYEINIHPTPGMDAQAIARAVRAELARIESEKGARRRSKLSDLE